MVLVMRVLGGNDIKDSFNGDDFCQCYRAEMGAPDNDYNINSQTGETTVTETDDDFDRV